MRKNYILTSLYLLNKIKKQNRNIKIFLFNYDGNKLKPHNIDIIKSINVNSGFTISNLYNADIIVYRKEEMIKVIIHELIHAFNIDDHNNESSYKSSINNIFCVKNSININETYTDSLACLINIIMYTILQKPKNITLHLSFPHLHHDISSKYLIFRQNTISQ